MEFLPEAKLDRRNLKVWITKAYLSWGVSKHHSWESWDKGVSLSPASGGGLGSQFQYYQPHKRGNKKKCAKPTSTPDSKHWEWAQLMKMVVWGGRKDRDLWRTLCCKNWNFIIWKLTDAYNYGIRPHGQQDKQSVMSYNDVWGFDLSSN